MNTMIRDDDSPWGGSPPLTEMSHSALRAVCLVEESCVMVQTVQMACQTGQWCRLRRLRGICQDTGEAGRYPTAVLAVCEVHFAEARIHAYWTLAAPRQMQVSYSLPNRTVENDELAHGRSTASK